MKGKPVTGFGLALVSLDICTCRCTSVCVCVLGKTHSNPLNFCNLWVLWEVSWWVVVSRAFWRFSDTGRKQLQILSCFSVQSLVQLVQLRVLLVGLLQNTYQNDFIHRNHPCFALSFFLHSCVDSIYQANVNFPVLGFPLTEILFEHFQHC